MSNISAMIVLVKCSVFIDFCLLFFLHFFILAVMPESTGHITYDKTINIVYNDKENIDITIRLEDPFDCMQWADLKYASTDEIVDSTNLNNAIQKPMLHSELKLLNTYNNSGILIIFYDTKSKYLAKERLFNFNYTNSRGLNETLHDCLTKCTIIFNIKKVFKKYCSNHGSFRHLCCESKPPTSVGVDSKKLITNEINAEIADRNSKEEPVKIDIFPNETKFYYNPDTKYTFKCNASRLPNNMYLNLTLNEAHGNKNKSLSTSEETSLEESLSLLEKYNTSKIYCEISLRTKPFTLYTKSTEIILFLKESKTQQNTSTQQDNTFHMNEYYIGLILGVLCLSVGVILYFYYKFRVRNNALQDTTVYTYATQQEVMYAQLQLDSNKSLSVRFKNERTPYTTIVGVLKPLNQNKEK